MVQVGDVAPDFRVQNHRGEETTLKQFSGKTVVLWFYPKASTGGCTAEGCGFRDRIEAYEAKGVQILGVSFDTLAENAKFAEDNHFPYPLLCDVDRQIGMAYGACDSPDAKTPKRMTFVVGPDGKLLQVHAQVNAREHPEALLKTL
ncbi:MAG: peroxiredoxin [Candidatus Latescibacteria bacterium]|nr:peroxiredoxin [Candidatus Latescibacterota bacterium]